MDWSNMGHTLQAILVALCALAFCFGVFAGQQR